MDAVTIERGAILRGARNARIGTVDAVFADYLLVRTAGLLPVDLYVPRTAVTEDDMLRAALEDVLAGPAGDYIRSHGGEVTVVSACDRRAEVRMSGTCAHCPAAGFTLHSRLESELRARFPSLRELRATEAPTKHRRTWLPLPGRHPA